MAPYQQVRSRTKVSKGPAKEKPGEDKAPDTEKSERNLKRRRVSESAQGKNSDDEDESGWTTVMNKTTTKKVDQSKLQIEAIREKSLRESKGLFKVTVSRAVRQEIEGVVSVRSEPFENNLLGLCTEIFRQFPFARPESRNGLIQVWTDTEQ